MKCTTTIGIAAEYVPGAVSASLIKPRIQTRAMYERY
jgi:hypothetical protein